MYRVDDDFLSVVKGCTAAVEKEAILYWHFASFLVAGSRIRECCCFKLDKWVVFPVKLKA